MAERKGGVSPSAFERAMKKVGTIHRHAVAMHLVDQGTAARFGEKISQRFVRDGVELGSDKDAAVAAIQRAKFLYEHLFLDPRTIEKRKQLGHQFSDEDHLEIAISMQDALDELLLLCIEDDIADAFSNSLKKTIQKAVADAFPQPESLENIDRKARERVDAAKQRAQDALSMKKESRDAGAALGDLRRGDRSGVEALVRRQNFDWNSVAPRILTSIASEIGLASHASLLAEYWLAVRGTNVREDGITLSAILRAFSKVQDIPRAKEVWEQIKTLDSKHLDVGNVSVVIRSLKDCELLQEVHDAWNHFSSLPDHELILDYRTVFSVFVSIGNHSGVREVWATVLQQNSAMNSEVLISAIHAFSRLEDVAGIHEVFQASEQKHIALDGVALSAAINTLGKFGDAPGVERAWRLIDARKEHCSATTYSAAIHALGAVRNQEGLRQAWEKCTHIPTVVSDGIVLGSAINAFGIMGDQEMVERVWQKIPSAGIQQTSVIGASMLAFGHVQSGPGVRKVWEYAKTHANHENRDVVSFALNAFGEVKDLNGAREVFDAMCSSRMEIDERLVTLAMKTFADLRDDALVRRAWNLVDARSIDVGSAGLSIAIRLFAESSDAEGVRTVFDDIQSRKNRVDIGTFRNAIDALGKVGDAVGVRDAWRAIQSSTEPIMETVLRASVVAFGKVGDTQGVHDVVALIHDLDVEVQARLHGYALTACGIVGDTGGFELLVSDIQKHNAELLRDALFSRAVMACKRLNHPVLFQELWRERDRASDDTVRYGVVMHVAGTLGLRPIFDEAYAAFAEIAATQITADDRDELYLSHVTAIKFGGRVGNQEAVSTSMRALSTDRRMFTARTLGKVITAARDMNVPELLEFVEANIHRLPSEEQPGVRRQFDYVRGILSTQRKVEIAL